jgi:branched-chain amino acid transport system substrate-binding protein
MKNWVYLSILLSLVLWLGGCDRKPAIEPSGKTIKVGIIAPFSGSHHATGKEGLKGMETARQVLPYLQNGDRIEWVVEDDKNEPAESARLLKKLVEIEKVSAIITFSSSNPVLAMAKFADDYQTPILAALATHPDVTKDNSFISQLCFDDDFQGTVAALFVRDDLLIDTVAVFNHPNDSYSRYLAAKFKSKFESIGGEITDTISITEETGDVFEIIETLRAKSPELLYLPLFANDVLRIIREVRNMDWNPLMMGSDGLISNMLAVHKEELHLVDGMMAIDVFAHGMPLTPFGKKASDKHGERGRGTIFAGLGVEGYAILLNAMNRCNDPTDRKCINRQIRSTNNFKGLAGNITIGSNGKARRPLCINSIQGGRSEFIFKVY